ncbi:transcriptional regulator [Streptomyces xiamenensis]|uniref:transcriptional regulator n=1 Tax=Streptomyces xiamenensis TaxID=408015 RepID=UPI00341F1D67
MAVGQPDDTMNHPLTYVRRVLLGTGKIRFAEMIRDHGRKLGINMATTRTVVFKWERGDHDPDLIAQRVIGDLLQVPDSVRTSTPWPYWLPAWEPTSSAVPWSQAASLASPNRLAERGSMDRRGFLSVGGAMLVGVGTQWSTADPAIAAAAHGDAVTSAAVDLMSQRVSSLRSMEEESGGPHFLESGRTDLRLITRMLDEGRYSEEIGRRLYALAAEVCCLLGWVSYDASLHTAAQEHYGAALRAAKTAGDDRLGVHTLCFLASQAANHREQTAAVGLMDTAEGARSKVPAIMQASLAAHQTTVYSKAGETRKAAAALNRAFDAFGRADRAEAPAYLTWFGEAQLGSTEGRYLLISGQARRATEALERSVNQASPRDKAVRYGTLALAYQDAGNLDGALEATHKAADLIDAGIHSQRGVERLQDVRRALRPHRNESRVREVTERIASLV